MIVNYADHSANERTFLAWVRTAIAIVGFELAAARFGNKDVELWSEVAMLIAGGLVILLAFFRMRYVRKKIAAKDAFDDGSIPADTLLLFVVAALFALLAVFAMHVG